jgi:hypothetical protein
MTTCHIQASGTIELYFYAELRPGDRADVERHLRGCSECRRALDELAIIRAALAGRPAVSAPPTGDWSGFMARLDRALAPNDDRVRPRTIGWKLWGAPRVSVASLAAAALLAIATIGVLVVLRARPSPDMTSAPTTSVERPSSTLAEDDRAFAASSAEHFDRSKLVVLGLATKDAARARAGDWTYERELASTLLSDTRMYRLAAEDRGLDTLAGVMRDLELVLLQTALTNDKDPASLGQIQRFIQRRDLVEKMDVVGTGL